MLTTNLLGLGVVFHVDKEALLGVDIDLLPWRDVRLKLGCRVEHPLLQES